MMSQEIFTQQAFIPTAPDGTLLRFNGTPNAVDMDVMMQQHIAAQQMQANIDQFQQRPFTPNENHFMVTDPNFAAAAAAAQMQFASALPSTFEPEDRRRKNSAATATNDKELRELLAKNETRILKDVAQEVIQKERTPQAEKTKQLFAMLW